MWWRTFPFWRSRGTFGYMWWQTFPFWRRRGTFGYMWWQTFPPVLGFGGVRKKRGATAANTMGPTDDWARRAE